MFMRMLIFAAIAGAVLTGCSGGSNEYAISVDEAKSQLLGANFDRGILPGSSGLKPRVLRSSQEDGSLEWHVQNEAESGGWWCPIAFETTSEDPPKVRVVNKCIGMTATKDNKNLDELVDATLTGRPPKFDR